MVMISVSQIPSSPMKAISSATGLVSLQLDPKYAFKAATKCSWLSTKSARLGYSSGELSANLLTNRVIQWTGRTTLLSVHLPRPNDSSPYSTRRERRERARGSSRSSSSHGASSSTLSVSAAASREDFFSEAEDLENGSRVWSSVSEKRSAMKAEENSGDDGEEVRVQKTTTALQAGGQESEKGSETLVLTEEEYQLTDEGTLCTVKVTIGGMTHRTNTKVERVLAEVGIQAESLQKKIQSFSVRKFIKDWGKEKPGLEDLKFNADMYAEKQGVSSIGQWSATGLTMQRAQLERISTDALYLVWAFSFLGLVRILEAVVGVFATRPPNPMRLMDAMNAMDPLTVASLASAMRQPVVGLLKVDPTNLEEVSSLKVKFLSELHRFYERQWKVGHHHRTGRRRSEALLSPPLRGTHEQQQQQLRCTGVKSWEPQGNGKRGVLQGRLGTSSTPPAASLGSSSVVGRIQSAARIPRGVSAASANCAASSSGRWEGLNLHQKKVCFPRNGFTLLGVGPLERVQRNSIVPLVTLSKGWTRHVLRAFSGRIVEAPIAGERHFLGGWLGLAWTPGCTLSERGRRCIAVHANTTHDGEHPREKFRKQEIHGRRTRVGRPKPCGPYENIMLQGFNWESHKGMDGKTWWQVLISQAEELGNLGITDVWLPPASQSVDWQGYLPGELYNLDASKYGTGVQLKELIDALHTNGMSVIADIVINHRSGKLQDSKGHWNIFKGGNRDKRLDWGPWAVVKDDSYDSGGKGHNDTGESYAAAPDLDHTSKQVQDELTDWMNWLKAEIGFDGWRFDFVKGYAPEYTELYCRRTNPTIAVGELWTSMAYNDGQLSWDQNGHRQHLCNWIDGGHGVCCAFDFTTKGILQQAVESEFWRLKDAQGKPPGLIGWWPEKAVTFLDNHDTGSTQRHWAFPDKNVLQGYVYMLTHPGIPCIFYDHIYSFKLKDEIQKLLDLRKRHRINAISRVNIQKAENDIYVAKIDNRVIVKLGQRYDMGSLVPGKDLWKLALAGHAFAIWETTTPLPPLPGPPEPAEDGDKGTVELSQPCPTQPVHITSKMSEETRNRILREIPELVGNVDAKKGVDATERVDAKKE